VILLCLDSHPESSGSCAHASIHTRIERILRTYLDSHPEIMISVPRPMPLECEWTSPAITAKVHPGSFLRHAYGSPKKMLLATPIMQSPNGVVRSCPSGTFSEISRSWSGAKIWLAYWSHFIGIFASAIESQTEHVLSGSDCKNRIGPMRTNLHDEEVRYLSEVHMIKITVPFFYFFPPHLESVFSQPFAEVRHSFDICTT